MKRIFLISLVLFMAGIAQAQERHMISSYEAHVMAQERVLQHPSAQVGQPGRHMITTEERYFPPVAQVRHEITSYEAALRTRDAEMMQMPQGRQPISDREVWNSSQADQLQYGTGQSVPAWQPPTQWTPRQPMYVYAQPYQVASVTFDARAMYAQADYEQRVQAQEREQERFAILQAKLDALIREREAERQAALTPVAEVASTATNEQVAVLLQKPAPVIEKVVDAPKATDEKAYVSNTIEDVGKRSTVLTGLIALLVFCLWMGNIQPRIQKRREARRVIRENARLDEENRRLDDIING